MEIFKILHFIGLVSLAVSFNMNPLLSHVKDLKQQIVDNFLNNNKPDGDNSKTNSLSNVPNTNNQCFCISNGPGSQLVVNNLGIINQGVERLVVYIYKYNGELKAFIPNKHKQSLIPELTLDQNDGDVFTVVSSITIAQLFNTSPNIVRYKITESSGFIIDIQEPSNPQPVYPETPQVIPPGGGLDISVDIPVNVPVQIPGDISVNMPNDQKHLRLQINVLYTLLKNILNLDTPDQLYQIFLTLSPQRQSYLLSLIPMLNISQNPTETPGGVLVPNSPLDINALVQLLLKVQSSGNTDQLYHIFSIFPSDIQIQIQSLLPQLQIPRMEDIRSFNVWFRNQLMRVVIYNLQTSVQLTELKRRILKVFETRGIRLSNGLLIDSNGSILDLSNIKLRAILVNVQGLQGPSSNIQNPSETSYLQVILISRINPPKLIAAVPMGRVYLSRVTHIHRNIQIFDGIQGVGATLKLIRPCMTCKIPLTKVPISIIKGLSSVKGVTSQTGGVALLDVPLRRNFEHEPDVAYQKSADAHDELNLQFDENLSENSVDQSNPDQGLDKDTVNTVQERIMGGYTKRPTGTTDDLPGYRIVGGNPATSSGTPLVSRGRSGYQSYII